MLSLYDDRIVEPMNVVLWINAYTKKLHPASMTLPSDAILQKK